MAAGSAAGALLLSIWVLQLDLSSCQSLPRFGYVGGNVTLSPASTVSFTEITWKKGINKIIDWSGNKEPTHYPVPNDRVHLDIKSGDLVLFNLTSSDEDEYEIESVDLTHGQKFNLTVLDPLPSPTLGCYWVNESISVHCEVPQSYRRHRDLLRCTWNCSSQQCENSSQLMALVANSPPELRFTKDDDLSQEVHCFVKDPVSSRTSSKVLSTCVPADNPRHRYLLIAITFVGIFFLIGFLCYARRAEKTT
nr:CD58 molecule [Pipistrellus kuhlii]